MKIGYLGPAGSYSEAVCKNLYPQQADTSWEYCIFPSLSQLITALHNKEVATIVIPVENSKNGLLKDHDEEFLLRKLLATDCELSVIAERFWPLHFLLLGNEAIADINSIKTIHVNPFGKEQCAPYLQKFPHWVVEKHNSSSDAARATKESGDVTHAGLASRDAALAYDLTILDDRVFPVGEEPVMHFLAVTHTPGLTAPQLESDVITSVAVTVESLPDLVELLKEQQIEISILRMTSDNKHGYLDIKNRFLAEEIASLLPAGSMTTYLGVFPACTHRERYAKQFCMLP